MKQNIQHSCEKEIQGAQLKITPARVATLQLFEAYEKPLDAHFAIRHLQKKLGVDRVTVFRILNTFVANRLLRKVEFGEGKARYELFREKDHHHVICRSCGDIVDVDNTVVPRLVHDLQKKTHFVIQSYSLEFFGLCENCQQ